MLQKLKATQVHLIERIRTCINGDGNYLVNVFNLNWENIFSNLYSIACQRERSSCIVFLRSLILIRLNIMINCLCVCAIVRSRGGARKLFP